MAGIKRKAKAAFEIVLLTFLFTLSEKTGMKFGKERFEREEAGG